MDLTRRLHKNGLVKPFVGEKIIVTTIDGVEHDDIEYIAKNYPPYGIWVKNNTEIINDSDIACWRYVLN